VGQDDIYQRRYLEHQARKAEVLRDLMQRCHSDRIFDSREVTDEVLDQVVAAAKTAPSSCNRQAVQIKVIRDRDDKARLGGLLVGGVGWIHRATVILLLHVDPEAYKAPGEIGFMPYLDVAFVADRILLAAEAEELKHCFVNPSIREADREHFQKIFGIRLFGGAIAIGWPQAPDWVLDTA
jgi:nitroreductase